MRPAAPFAAPVAADHVSELPPRPPPRCIAVLGREDHPTDAVEDYCKCLALGFQKKGRSLEIVRVRWEEQGWRQALRDLSGKFEKQSEETSLKKSWALLQYTALSWSRRGFPLRFASLVNRLSDTGVRILIVFHDPHPFTGTRLVDRVRTRVQLHVMRGAARKAEKIVTTLSPDCIPWMQDWMEDPAIRQKISAKTVTLPAGSNVAVVPGYAPISDRPAPVIAVFGVTEHSPETDLLASVVRRAAEDVGAIHLTVFGRGAQAAGPHLRELLDGSPVELEDLGILEPRQAGQILAQADVQLFVRSGVSSRRSSAVAGIVCGLPIVGFADKETGFPITEAGVRLVPRGDRQGLIRELVQVLLQPALREQLRRRNLEAAERYFSWDRIADGYLALME